VHIVFVPREANRWADWLSKVGANLNQDATLSDLGVTPEEHSCPPPTTPMLAAVASPGGDTTCRVCKQGIEGASVECQGCTWEAHLRCLGVTARPRVPYTCQQCKDWARLANIEGVMLDTPLHEFVAHGKVPKDPIHELKLRRAATFVSIDEVG
jgi:hypothetical protein